MSLRRPKALSANDAARTGDPGIMEKTIRMRLKYLFLYVIIELWKKTDG